MKRNDLTLGGLRAPYMAEYFGVWCIEATRFQAMVDRARGIDLRQHLRRQEKLSALHMANGSGPGRSYGYDVTRNGTALVDISGSLMKAQSSMDASASTVMLRNTVRRLKADDEVTGVMLRIDSPGGSAAGTQDLADDIAALAAVKPVGAYIEDLGCSAAYWIASQCQFISTNRTGIVGSIGTYCTIYDTASAAAMQGIKVHVLSTGPLKGQGVDGTAITPAQLAAWQTMVDDLNGQFLAAVSRGRKMSMEKLAPLADGGVHVGQAAKDRGFVDYVESLDDAMQRLQTLGPSGPVQAPTAPRKRAGASSAADAGASIATESGAAVAAESGATELGATPDAGATLPTAETTADGSSAGDPTQQATETSGASAPDPDAATQETATMPTPTPAAPAPTAGAATEPKPATIAELKQAFPKDPAFALEAAEKCFTLTEARAAYADVLQSKLTQLETKQAAAAQEEPAPKRIGVAPMESTVTTTGKAAAGAYTGDAKVDFEAAVQQEMKSGKNRAAAVRAAAIADPDLHAAYIAGATDRYRTASAAAEAATQAARRAVTRV